MKAKASKVDSMPPRIFEDYQNRDGNGVEKRVTPRFASFRPHSAPSQEFGKFSDRRPDVSAETASNNCSDYGKHLSITGDPRERHEHQAIKEGKTPQSFAVDTTGDPDNLTFGRLHRHTTPSYYRFGLGNVLGACTGQKIDGTVSSEKGLVISYNQQGSPGKRNGGALRIAKQTETNELKIKRQASNSSSFDAGTDFVSLRAAQETKKRRTNQRSNLTSSSSSDGDNKHYRSLAGKAKAKDAPDDPDLIYGSDGLSSLEERGNFPSTLADLVLRKRLELSRKIDVDPANVDAWLDLIQQHDHVSGTFTNAERKSNADIRLSLYEKALSNVEEPNDRELLLLGRMNEAAQVWDTKKLLSEWQSILQNNPQYLRLWNNYLDFRQTTFASFSYEEVRGLYVDCSSLLLRSQQAPGRLLVQRAEIYIIQIHILLRMTLFMRESGFVEQAVSGWQALLEYEYSKPFKLQDDEHKRGGTLHHVTISNFEEFWDSEVPRIGEDGCRGWASFSEAGKPPQAKTETASIRADSQDAWEFWVNSEYKRGLVTRSPARTIDDVVEDDPYRVILFSDIRPFLIDSPSVESRAVCLDAFLAFCHLPPCQARDPAGRSRSWRRDGYVRNETLYTPTGALQSWIISPLEDQKTRLESDEVQKSSCAPNSPRRSLFDLPISDYQLSLDSLFAVAGSWFGAFEAWQSEFSEGYGPVETTWILRSLKQLVATHTAGESLPEYSLALELRLSPGTIKKTARDLLRERPSSLPIYNAYALIEYRLGNTSMGEKAIATSICMAKTLRDSNQRDSILLWRTWIWELLSGGNPKEALMRIISYGDKDTQSALPATDASEDQGLKPALLLRTERALTATRDHMLSLRSLRHAALAIECLVLFQYLQTSLSLSAATSTFKYNISILSPSNLTNSTTLEYLHQGFARLLYHHSTLTHLVKPSEIRSLLAESITLFPQNTIFLSLYAWNEARFRIDDRVRSIMKDVALRPYQHTSGKHHESVVSHFFAIHMELNRGVTLGSNILTIRSTFERAVRSDSGTHCAGLWKLYFLFEHSRADIIKAKNVFWRCLKACPWAKELYMLAFEYLRGTDGLRNEELRSIYELLGEKEIRIHVSLEDVLGDYG